jgi:Proteasome subunit
MKQIRSAALLTILCSLLCFAAVGQENSGAGTGTLGLIIITKDGLVFAADSRTTYGNGVRDDSAVKIFKLSEHSGCMLAGIVVQRPLRTPGFEFDLIHEIRALASVPNLKDLPSVYADLLQLQLSAAIDRGLINLPQLDSFEDDPEIASVLMGGYGYVQGGGVSKIPDYYIDQASKIKYMSRGSQISRYNSVYTNVVRNYFSPEIAGPVRFSLFTNGNDQLLTAMLRGRQKWSITTITHSFRTDVDLRGAQADPQARCTSE